MTRRFRIALHSVPLLVLATLPAPGAAQTPAEPADTEGIGIFEHIGDQVPLDLTFTD
jgi:hypothetical protein